MRNTNVLVFFMFLLSLVACKGEDPVTIEPQYSDTSTVTATFREGRIGLRSKLGEMKFFDQANDTNFVPMGYNYTHVLDYVYKGIPLVGHATFHEGHYQPEVSKKMLLKLKKAGYNVVRVFLNPILLSEEKPTLDQDYLLNIVDFVKQADEQDLSVIITTDMIPLTYYETQVLTESDIWWWNDQYINKKEIDYEILFWQRFITELKTNSVPLEAIFAYEIRNEFFFHPDHAPFNKTSGTVVHPNGKSYDMSIEKDRNALIDASFMYWSSSVRDAIKEKDVDALVTVGFYGPEPLGRPSLIALGQSELDFIDLHMYPEEASLVEYVNYFGLLSKQSKPIIMGEFGYLNTNGLSINAATGLLLNWKNEAVSKYQIDGWMLWTLDTETGSKLSIPDDNDVLFNAFSPGK